MTLEFIPDSGSGGGIGSGLPGTTVGLLPPGGQTDKLALLEAAIGKPIPLAFGVHLIGGNEILNEEVANGERVIMRALGEGEMDGPIAIFVNGKWFDHTDTSRYHFHPGLDGEVGVETDPAVRNQKICSLWPSSFADKFTFPRTAYDSMKLAPDPAAPDAMPRVIGIYRTRKVRIFDSGGTQTAFQYSTNPADIYEDLLISAFVKPRGLINEALTTAEKAFFDFAQRATFATDCDVSTPQSTTRFEAHPAFYSSTDLLRALELLFLLSRGYHLEKAGKFAPFMNKARASALTLGPNDFAPGSFSLGERDTRDAANKYFGKFRNLDSGKGAGTIATTGTAVTGTSTKFLKWFRAGSPVRLTDGAQAGQVRRVASVASDLAMTLVTAFSADQAGRLYSNPELQLSKGEKYVEDETHQTEVGRVLTLELDLHNQIPERAERILKYTKAKALDVVKQTGLRALWIPGVLDLLPGDVFTAPGKWDFLEIANNQEWDLLKLVINQNMSFELGGEEYDAALYSDAAGAQQDIVPALPGTGLLPVSGGASYSYRPLSNPLAATDAGATATVNVAALTNRIAGLGDLAINSGSIAGLSYSTLYYIYFDDLGNPPTAGAKTFAATTVKETALNGAGRFYMGSILTPAAGAADTVGKNDGGTGAQIGGHVARKALFNSIDPVNTNDANANDGSWSSKGTCTVTGNITGAIVQAKVYDFSSIEDQDRYYKNLRLKIKGAASCTNETGGTPGTTTLLIQYSISGGASFTTLRSTTAVGAGATAALAAQIDEIALPDGTNPALVQARVRATGHTGGTGDNGSIVLDMYETVLEGDF